MPSWWHMANVGFRLLAFHQDAELLLVLVAPLQCWWMSLPAAVAACCWWPVPVSLFHPASAAVVARCAHATEQMSQSEMPPGEGNRIQAQLPSRGTQSLPVRLVCKDDAQQACQYGRDRWLAGSSCAWHWVSMKALSWASMKCLPGRCVSLKRAPCLQTKHAPQFALVASAGGRRLSRRRCSRSSLATVVLRLHGRYPAGCRFRHCAISSYGISLSQWEHGPCCACGPLFPQFCWGVWPHAMVREAQPCRLAVDMTRLQSGCAQTGVAASILTQWEAPANSRIRLPCSTAPRCDP